MGSETGSLPGKPVRLGRSTHRSETGGHGGTSRRPLSHLLAGRVLLVVDEPLQELRICEHLFRGRPIRLLLQQDADGRHHHDDQLGGARIHPVGGGAGGSLPLEEQGRLSHQSTCREMFTFSFINNYLQLCSTVIMF